MSTAIIPYVSCQEFIFQEIAKICETSKRTYDVAMRIYFNKELLVTRGKLRALAKVYSITDLSSGTLLKGLFKQDFSRLNIPIASLRLSMTVSETSDEVIFELPDTIMSNLCRFLEGPEIPTYCCVDFVQQLFGMKEKLHAVGSWTGALLDDTNLMPGVAILMYQNESSDRPLGRLLEANQAHWAIYIGHDLYLSIAGVDGFLITATLDEMRKIYPCTHVFVLSPRT